MALDRGSRLTPTKPCSERPHRRAHAFETTADTRTTAKMALSPRHRCVRVLLPPAAPRPPSRLSSRREIASSFTRSHPPPRLSLRAASTPRTEPDPTRHIPRGRSARSPARSPTSRYAATSRTGGASAQLSLLPRATRRPRGRAGGGVSRGARRPSPRSPRSTVNPYRLTRSIEP